jgi:hypothetical protein
MSSTLLEGDSQLMALAQEVDTLSLPDTVAEILLPSRDKLSETLHHEFILVSYVMILWFYILMYKRNRRLRLKLQAVICY